MLEEKSIKKASGIRKGSRIETSGKGKTKEWDIHKGTVTRRSGNKVFVNWDGTLFEDEMELNEVKELN